MRIKGCFLKTMKVEGAQEAQMRTAENVRRGELKADGGGGGWGVNSGERVKEEEKRSEASRKLFRRIGFW